MAYCWMTARSTRRKRSSKRTTTTTKRSRRGAGSIGSPRANPETLFSSRTLDLWRPRRRTTRTRRRSRRRRPSPALRRSPRAFRPAPASRPTAPPPSRRRQAGRGQAAAGQTGSAKPAAQAGREARKAAPAEHKAKAWVGADGGNRKFGQVLVDLGYIDQEQLWDLLEQARSTDQSLSRVVLDRGLVTEDQLLQAQGERHGLAVANLEEQKPTPEALKLVPENMAQIYKILPLKFEGDTLTVVMSDPDNLSALDDLRNFLGIKQVEGRPRPAPADRGGPEDRLRRQAGVDHGPDRRPWRPKAPSGGRGRETSIDLEDMMELAESAPVRKLINMMLLMGIKDRASDIHFEPFEEEYKIRHAVRRRALRDGPAAAAPGRRHQLPHQGHVQPRHRRAPAAAGRPDRAERRRQPGRPPRQRAADHVRRERRHPGARPHASSASTWRRSAWSRTCSPSSASMIHKPNGIVLVTGPTGAGKTTTLYSALNELNQITDKIITTEDPVEYEIDGIVQCPINHEIDLTFASALRAILRQDPDIILVGEIRDLETAQIAMQASLTGHMVFSTLHTNDAPSTITRLRDMGVEPFLITATVEGILAQRLVRKICTDCRTEYDPTGDQVMELGLKPDEAKAQGMKFYYGAGCDKCNNLGFKGRTGIYELIMMTDDLRDMVSSGASHRPAARRHMRQMGDRGPARGRPGRPVRRRDDDRRGRPRDGAGRRRRETVPCVSCRRSLVETRLHCSLRSSRRATRGDN